MRLFLGNCPRGGMGRGALREIVPLDFASFMTTETVPLSCSDVVNGELQIGRLLVLAMFMNVFGRLELRLCFELLFATE